MGPPRERRAGVLSERPRPGPTGYTDGRTYYRPVQTVEGKWIHVPVCYRCGSDHRFGDPVQCIEALAERIAALEKRSTP